MCIYIYMWACKTIIAIIVAKTMITLWIMKIKILKIIVMTVTLIVSVYNIYISIYVTIYIYI